MDVYVDNFRARIDEYVRNGSGYQFLEMGSATVHIAKYNPLRGAGSIEIPEIISKSRSVLNIQTKDNRCFLFAVLAELCKADNHPERPQKYFEHIGKIKMGNVQFSVKISDIKTVERLNNLSIWVYEWNYEDKELVAVKHGSGQGKEINLLYLNDSHSTHYMLIINFNRLMRIRSKYCNSMFYCKKCLHGFKYKDQYESHSADCKQDVFQTVSVPDSGEIKFKNYHKQQKRPFAIYCDFETLTLPLDTCTPDPKQSFTTAYQHHVPCSYSIVTTSTIDGYIPETITYTNKDPASVSKCFIDELNRLYADMTECYKNNSFDINMTPESERRFKSATHCHICGDELDWTSRTNYVVRDHDHKLSPDNFRGAAHR